MMRPIQKELEKEKKELERLAAIGRATEKFFNLNDMEDFNIYSMSDEAEDFGIYDVDELLEWAKEEEQ